MKVTVSPKAEIRQVGIALCRGGVRQVRRGDRLDECRPGDVDRRVVAADERALLGGIARNRIRLLDRRIAQDGAVDDVARDCGLVADGQRFAWPQLEELDQDRIVACAVTVDDDRHPDGTGGRDGAGDEGEGRIAEEVRDLHVEDGGGDAADDRIADDDRVADDVASIHGRRPVDGLGDRRPRHADGDGRRRLDALWRSLSIDEGGDGGIRQHVAGICFPARSALRHEGGARPGRRR